METAGASISLNPARAPRRVLPGKGRKVPRAGELFVGGGLRRPGRAAIWGALSGRRVQGSGGARAGAVALQTRISLRTKPYGKRSTARTKKWIAVPTTGCGQLLIITLSFFR